MVKLDTIPVEDMSGKIFKSIKSPLKIKKNEETEVQCKKRTSKCLSGQIIKFRIICKKKSYLKSFVFIIILNDRSEKTW